jgi:glutamine---fructose-6-phosphate transaminase (isomerizing)
MCGIIGYLGKNEASPVIFKALQTLEYRGYDSCGAAIINDEKIQLIKDIGKVEQVLKGIDFQGYLGIGHTRWATHGKVTKENAHPHLSNSGKIAVVHNGIIENYQELRKFLSEKGFKLKSETDTETIPNLIELYMKEGMTFTEATKKTLKKIKGSYAILAIHTKEDIVIGARKDSPLVMGIGEQEYFIASDIPAFLDYTKNAIYLDNMDMVILTKKEMKIFNLEKNTFVEHKISKIDWNPEQAKKGKFDHFMLKEITEQAESIKNSLRQDKKCIQKVVDAIKSAKGVYFVACGTAFHACLTASYIFSKIAKKHINVSLASEFPNYKDFIIPESLVIAVSQSGETADTLEAIRAAKSKGAKVISIVNVMGSSLARESDHCVMQNAGPEIAVLATKSYTSQLSILTLIAYALAGKYDEGYSKLNDIIRYIYYLTSESAKKSIKKIAEKLKDANHIYVIGRDLQYPTALEAALKIKEVSYIHAEGFAGGELKHGPIALIEEGTPCIVFTSDDTMDHIVGNISELKARGATIIGIDEKNNELFDYFIKVRESEEANSICQIIPIQILAYQLALLRGCNPDQPRNLAKSVTVK